MRVKRIQFFALLLAVMCAATLICPVIYAENPIGVYYHVATTEKVIALTFDDGPHPKYTDEILRVLEQEKVRATFFVIGSNVALYPDVTRRVMLAGHEIGNHTYNHPIVRKTAIQQMEEEIQRTDALLRELGYGGNNLFRPPQGLFSEALPALLEKNNKATILWNIDTRDWAHRSSAEIIDEISQNVCGGDIILFHDYVSGESTTIPAIKKLIPMLKERGYQFVTESELLSLKDG